MSRLQIQKILLQVNNTENPDDKISLLKQAIAIADTDNDLTSGFDLRKELISTEKDTARCLEGLPAIAWLLEALDKNTDMFSAKELMLEYKWMVSSARRNVDISSEQLYSIMEDYKQRLLDNSFTLHSYYTLSVWAAYMENNIPKAEELLQMRDKEQKDDLSFCEACELADKIELEFAKGNIDKAIQMGSEIFSLKTTCRYVPLETISNHIGKLTNFEKLQNWCKEMFEVAIKELNEIDRGSSDTPIRGLLIEYLAKTDRDMAFDMFEKSVLGNINSEHYYDYLYSRSVLPLLKTKEIRELNIPSEVPWYKFSGEYDTSELYNYYFEKAENLAQSFDKRHNTTKFIDELNATINNI